jgi:hypothetical protein
MDLRAQVEQLVVHNPLRGKSPPLYAPSLSPRRCLTEQAPQDDEDDNEAGDGRYADNQSDQPVAPALRSIPHLSLTLRTSPFGTVASMSRLMASWRDGRPGCERQ